MSTRNLGLLALVGIVLAAGAGFWFGNRRAGPPPTSAAAPAAAAQAPAVVVEATKVVTASLPQAITTVGSLRSDESVTVRPEVAGRVNEIAFREGQRVAKGDVLIRLDPAINAAEVQQARANLTLAKSKFDRAVDLAKSNFISSQAKDEAENNLRVAEAALALAEARLAKTEIRAPWAGVIGLRQVSVGDYVKEGADIVNLEVVDPLKVDFRVPEIYLSQVRVGQTLEVGLDALPGKTYAGSVLAINPLVDAAGRSIVIRAQVRNTDTRLRPGMFARVRLITDARAESLVIPEQALVPQGTDQYVFKIVNGKAQRVKVDIGQRRDARVEIVSGLSSDDVVVTAGHIKLRDGAPVQVAASKPASSEPAAASKASGAAPETAASVATPKS